MQHIDHYADLHGNFRWHVPEDFNIAEVCCTRWAKQTPHAVAIREHVSGRSLSKSKTYTYFELQQAANAMSAKLADLGVKRGDRVAIVLPQRFETAVAYMAVLQMGAIAVPLSMLFGPDALEYRLNDSDAVVAIADEVSEPSLRQIQSNCPNLRSILPIAGVFIAYTAIKSIVKSKYHVATKADDGAILIYTSGTTGPPKGALIPHRALIGNLTGFVCSQNWFGFAKSTNAIRGRSATAYRNHLSCWRSTPRDRRNRTTTAAVAPNSPTRYTIPNNGSKNRCSSTRGIPSMPIGLSIR